MKSFVFIVISLPVFLACKDKPFEPNYEFAGGYVIGKEKCNIDTTKDYWLIDFSVFPVTNGYGDTLILNGIQYNHVVKTTGLDPIFKFIGARVGIRFNIGNTLVQTSGCLVSNPETYLLKEIQIIAQGELR
jgi:hypothetical protein